MWNEYEEWHILSILVVIINPDDHYHYSMKSDLNSFALPIHVQLKDILVLFSQYVLFLLLDRKYF